MGPQFLKLVHEFTLGRIDIKRLNYGVLALLPKVTGADNIRQFRPILLINVSFHLMPKGFATRLSPVGDRIINPNQTTLIRGSIILDGVAVPHEVLHKINTTKEEMFILKINFKKAYDRVRLDFLEDVLRAKGFDPLWISWMRQFVQGGGGRWQLISMARSEHSLGIREVSDKAILYPPSYLTS